MFYNLKLCLGAVVLCLVFFPEIGIADLKNPIWAVSPCVSGGDNVKVNGTSCGPVDSEWNSFRFLYGAGQKIGQSSGLGFVSSQYGVYPPFSGEYKMYAHFCATEDRNDRCTLGKSYLTVESLSKVNLVSSTELAYQDGSFGGGNSAVLPSKSSMCWTLVDSRGEEWTANSPAFCSDAHKLPSTPATCYINYQEDLIVDMGTIERGKITTVPASGAAGNIKKTFPILCTRDAGVTVSTTFQFTPLTISGNEVVSTSAANLGVAVFYNGKLISPNSFDQTENFGVGYTDRELEFQVVRDPNVELKKIAAGDFKANLVMVMTEQ